MFQIRICTISKLYSIAAKSDMTDVAAILVSSKEIEKEHLKGFYKTLCLNFADTFIATKPNVITQSDSDMIAEFVKSLPININTLYICSDRGKGRSTAIAAAIIRYTQKNEMVVWNNPQYSPNFLVYKYVCNSSGYNISDDEVQEKFARNNSAPAKALKTKKSFSKQGNLWIRSVRKQNAEFRKSLFD